MRVKVTTTQANQTRWKKKDGLPPRLFAMPLSSRTPYTCRNNPGDTNRVLSRACFKEVSLPKSHSVDSAWLAITLGVSYIDSEISKLTPFSAVCRLPNKTLPPQRQRVSTQKSASRLCLDEQNRWLHKIQDEPSTVLQWTWNFACNQSFWGSSLQVNL